MRLAAVDGRRFLVPARMAGGPGGPCGILQHGTGIVIQGAEQLGEGGIDRVGIGRPTSILLAKERSIRAAEGGGQDVHAHPPELLRYIEEPSPMERRTQCRTGARI